MNSIKKITVLLAEDHAIVREGLCRLLELEGHFEIVGQAENGREAVALAAALQPEVILMDIGMPVLNGLEATRQIVAANPHAKVLILSAHGDDEYIDRAATVGAAGFLEKQTSAEVFTAAIREVARGKSFFSPAIARRMSDRRNRSRDRQGLPKPGSLLLTSREMEVLQLVAEGNSNRETATSLHISIKTVEKHRQHLMDKLNLHETAGLTRYAIAHGVIKNNVEVTIVGADVAH
ncbi:MAG: response regulator transcription factor [Opitutaceae bacterium]